MKKEPKIVSYRKLVNTLSSHCNDHVPLPLQTKDKESDVQLSESFPLDEVLMTPDFVTAMKWFPIVISTKKRNPSYVLPNHDENMSSLI